jgi:hypothetical protein
MATKLLKVYLNTRPRADEFTHIKADLGYPLSICLERREYDNRLGGRCLLEMSIYPIAMACFS